MMLRLCKSIVPFFTIGLMFSLVGCGDMPNPFSSKTTPIILDSSSQRSISNFSVEPETIHPGDKFVVRALLQDTSSASVSIEIIDVVANSSTPIIVEQRSVSVPSGGMELAEEFTAPSTIGTYSATVQAGDFKVWKQFVVTQ